MLGPFVFRKCGEIVQPDRRDAEFCFDLILHPPSQLIGLNVSVNEGLR